MNTKEYNDKLIAKTRKLISLCEQKLSLLNQLLEGLLVARYNNVRPENVVSVQLELPFDYEQE